MGTVQGPPLVFTEERTCQSSSHTQAQSMPQSPILFSLIFVSGRTSWFFTWSLALTLGNMNDCSAKCFAVVFFFFLSKFCIHLETLWGSLWVIYDVLGISQAYLGKMSSWFFLSEDKLKLKYENLWCVLSYNCMHWIVALMCHSLSLKQIYRHYIFQIQH